LKQNILVLEDDSDIGNLIRHHLQLAGFNVSLCVSGDEVLPQARKHPPVLFLLDIMVPGHSGFEVCRKIRESTDLASVPIIFLTARAGEEDRFEQPLTTSITAPDFELHNDSMTLTVRGKLTDVTATEFRLLHFLASHPGRVYSRDQVLDAVWRDLSFVTPRSVDVYIRRLREKIEPDPEDPKYLKTVRGAGYKFEAAK
jgi:two-component system phosphate regulon response regulator PhoB